MAFDPKPTTWLPSWASDGTAITLPIASIPNLTAGEANATTGDIRKVLFHLFEKLLADWNATAVADRPGKLVMLKSAQFDQAANQITDTYTFVIVTDVGTTEVAAEDA